MSRRYRAADISEELRVKPDFIVQCIRSHWIYPVKVEREEALQLEGMSFDEEDLARIRLIRELRDELGVNDEAIPIILHLLDQLHALYAHARIVMKKAS